MTKHTALCGLLVAMTGCAAYDVGVEFCTEAGCIKIEPHVVHLEILEPVEDNQVGE